MCNVVHESIYSAIFKLLQREKNVYPKLRICVLAHPLVPFLALHRESAVVSIMTFAP